MVKNKNEDEDEDEIIEKDKDEDEAGDKKDSEESDSKEEKEIEVEIVEEDEKDERIVVQGRKPREEETQEEKRARRRAERQKRNSQNYANRRELETVKQTLARLAKENEDLRAMAGEFGKREANRDEQQLDSAINQQKSLYNTAMQQLTQAITEGNGNVAAEAQRVITDANNKYNQLIGLKNNQETKKRTEPEPVVQRDDPLKATYTTRWLAKNDWFDPGGSDEDSKLAKEIDSEVAKDGFNPATREYWDELNARLKEELPHVYDEKPVRKPRPKQVNGSMGADSSPSNAKPVKIPERVIKMAKDAGFWDDPKKKKLFLNNYREQNGQAG